MKYSLKYWMWVAVIWSCLCILTMMGAGAQQQEAEAVRYWQTRLAGARMPTGVRAMVSPLSSHEASQLLINIQQLGSHYLPTHAEAFCTAAHIRCPAHLELEKESKLDPTSPQKEGSQRAAEALIKKPSTASDPQNLLAFYYEHEKEDSRSTEPLKNPIASDPQNLLAFYYEHDKEDSQSTIASDPQNLLAFYYEHDKEDSQSTKGSSQRAQPLKKLTASDAQNLLAFYYEHQKEGSHASNPQNLLAFYYERQKKGSQRAAEPLKKPSSASDPQNLLAFYYEHDKQDSQSTKGGSQRAKPLKKLTASEYAQNLLAFYYEHEKDGLEGSHRISVSTKKQDGLHREIFGVFFREQQVLVRGVDIHVNFAYGVDQKPEERAFLPRKLAKLFPLAAGGGSEIASKLGLLDEDLRETIKICTSNIDMNRDVDVRRCLSSIEDVADFVHSVMGQNNINVYDAVAINASAAADQLVNAGKTFHVVDVKTLKAELDEPAVACHDMAFPFRVFFCHYVKQTMIFQATLRSAEDGSVHERIAVCHYDTSYWAAWHMSFAELNTKPGESEACHWLGGAWLHHRGWVFVRGAAAAAAATA